MRLMAALPGNMLTVSIFLSVFFLPGALAHYCDNKPVTFSITAPNNTEALSGSCLEIPCSFTTDHPKFNRTFSIYGVWMKHTLDFDSNPNDVIFNSSKSVNAYPLKLSGNLAEKNCTTLFPDLNSSHTDKYFFRIENGEFRATGCAHPLKITVRDSPWTPSINVPSDLKEHQSVTVTCSAFTPCPHSPPELTWNLQQDSLRQTEKNTEGTFTTKIQETITLSDTHDGYNIRCSARYPVTGGNKTAETEVTLSVSYAPRNTSASISPSGLVSAGSWVELSCSSRAKPPPSFTWFKNSKDGATNVSVGPVYKLQMTNMTKIESHFCVAENILGKQTTSWSHLKNKETGMQTVLGAVILLFIFVGLICLVFSVCFFKSKHRTPQQPQAQPDEDVTVQMPPDKSEELDYEDMNDFQSRPEAFYESMKDRGQEGAVYAKVKKFRARSSSVQTADSSEGSYIEMKQQ